MEELLQELRAEQPMHENMRDMWNADVSSLPVAKDVPRLVSRVSVYDEKGDILFLAPGETPPDSMLLGFDGSNRRKSKLSRWSKKKKTGVSHSEGEDSANRATMRNVINLIYALAEKLEPAAAIDTELLESILADVDNGSDLQQVMEEILKVIGPDGKVTRALKTIHQNIVLQSTIEIKKKLTMKFPTKDLRTSEGWRIIVTFAKGYIQIRHCRREQSLDTFGDTKNHWEFEWELRMTFDDKMLTMTAAQLRITRLILSDTIDEDLAEELKNTLVDGLIVM